MESNALLSFESLFSGASSRRAFVRSGLGGLAVGFFTSRLDADPDEALPFSFKGVDISDEDGVVVPDGYDRQVVYAWGDPIDGQSPVFKGDASETAEEQARQAGMGHDGMEWFPWPGDDPARSDRGLLVLNHEYTDQGLLFPDGLDTMSAEKVRKCQAAHGVSVIAVERRDGVWTVVPSEWSRRITATTPMRLTGPAAGSPRVRTALDPEGLAVLGTFNNCASGKTPWGTYLTCEENFNGYFGTDREGFEPSADQRRYGFAATGTLSRETPKRSLYQWWKHDGRFDLALHPTEANRFGYIVEIDPSDPASSPRKHTALGRFKHENAATTLAKDGRVVVYLGDDEKNEYIYKFVSKKTFHPDDRTANLDLLTEGTLHVARFLDDGRGRWIPLVHGEHGLTGENGFADQAGIAVRTRQAADRVGATMMDRPEWIAVHPATGEVFVTLTNNDQRGLADPTVNAPDGTAEAGKSRPPVDAANPRAANEYGHILKWSEEDNDAAAESFVWEHFLLAGDPGLDDGVSIRGDSFGSPDGLVFDPKGDILWIQTDVSTSKLGKDAYGNLGNNMMLAADPRTRTVRRFLTGPKGCEVTGLAFTPDRRTLFVNIQHPGEPATEVSDPRNPLAVSQWPDPAQGRPRPATVAVFRPDGHEIGV